MFKAHQWWAEGHLVWSKNAVWNSLATGLKGRQEGVSWWGREAALREHSLIFIWESLSGVGFICEHPQIAAEAAEFILKPCFEQMLLFSVSTPNMKKCNPSTSVCSYSSSPSSQIQQIQKWTSHCSHLFPLALFGASHGSSLLSVLPILAMQAPVQSPRKSLSPQFDELWVKCITNSWWIPP